MTKATSKFAPTKKPQSKSGNAGSVLDNSSPCSLQGFAAMMTRIWRQDEGVVTFEWILLLTLLVIGVVGGVAGIRDAILHECQGVVGAMVSLDQSYSICGPLGVWCGSAGSSGCTSGGSSSSFVDSGGYSTGRVTLSNAMTVSDSGHLCPVVF